MASLGEGRGSVERKGYMSVLLSGKSRDDIEFLDLSMVMELGEQEEEEEGWREEEGGWTEEEGGWREGEGGWEMQETKFMT